MWCLSASDLSAAMGHLGDPGHNDVQAAIRAAIFQITSAGKAAGILSTDVALARDYAELGPTFVAFGTDVGLLVRAARPCCVRSIRTAHHLNGGQRRVLFY